MKRFLLKLALFAFILLLTGCLLDRYISVSIKKSGYLAHGEYDVWDDIYNGSVNADLVIYGSSRAWVHIDPELLSNAFNISCYNLGIDGHKFRLQYFRHKELLKYNKRPKIIIHSLDDFTLVKDTDSYNYDQFLPYMFLNSDIFKATASNKYFNIADFIFPYIRYIGKKEIINYAYNKNNSEVNELHRVRGYTGRNQNWNNDLENARKAIGHYKIQIDKETVNLFEKYLRECKNMNIKVILVYTPEYIEGQHFVINRDEIMRLYNNISDKFHVPFYNYSNDSICFQKKYFYNAMHLNKTGSELFTKSFIEDLKRDKQIQVLTKRYKSSANNLNSIENEAIN